MGRITIATGLAMIVLGVIAYVATSFASATALIPAFFGVPIAILGAVARNPARAKPAGIAALVIALLGLLGTASRLVPALLDGTLTADAATIVQILFTLLALAFLVAGSAKVLRKKGGG